MKTAVVVLFAASVAVPVQASALAEGVASRVKHCYLCRKQNTRDARFCQECGQKLDHRCRLGFDVGVCQRGLSGFSCSMDYFPGAGFGTRVELGMFQSGAGFFSAGDHERPVPEAAYSFPVSILYQRQFGNLFDPVYFGLGLSRSTYRVPGPVERSGAGIDPVLTVGINVLPDAFSNFVLFELKHFINRAAPEASLTVLSYKAGFSW